jgi:hypothetical protein
MRTVIGLLGRNKLRAISMGRTAWAALLVESLQAIKLTVEQSCGHCVDAWASPLRASHE